MQKWQLQTLLSLKRGICTELLLPSSVSQWKSRGQFRFKAQGDRLHLWVEDLKTCVAAGNHSGVPVAPTREVSLRKTDFADEETQVTYVRHISHNLLEEKLKPESRSPDQYPTTTTCVLLWCFYSVITTIE